MPKLGTYGVGEISDLKTVESVVEETLLDMASRELGVPREQLVVRDADPREDFGLASSKWEATLTTANAFNDFVDTTIADNRFVAIYGVNRATDNFTLVKFISGAKTLDVWNTEVVYGLENPVKIAKAPIVLRQNTPIKIQLYATSTGVARPLLLAKVAEVKGRSVEPG